MNTSQGYFDYIKTIDAKTYLSSLAEIGWFNYVTPDQKSKIEKCITKSFVEKSEYVYTCLAILSFDSERIYDLEDEGYRPILEEFKQCSSGKFMPESVQESIVGTNLRRVTFLMNNREYSIDLDTRSDYYDSSVTSLINQSLKDAGYKEKFIELPTSDQTAHFILVTEETYAKAVKDKLIPALRDIMHVTTQLFTKNVPSNIANNREKSN